MFCLTFFLSVNVSFIFYPLLLFSFFFYFFSIDLRTLFFFSLLLSFLISFLFQTSPILFRHFAFSFCSLLLFFPLLPLLFYLLFSLFPLSSHPSYQTHLKKSEGGYTRYYKCCGTGVNNSDMIIYHQFTLLLLNLGARTDTWGHLKIRNLFILNTEQLTHGIHSIGYRL